MKQPPSPSWAKGLSENRLFYAIMGEIEKLFPFLSQPQKVEVSRYAYIFLANGYTKHWQVNNHITNINQWDKFNEMRSLNDHGYNRLIKGIKPKYFRIICQLLEIEGFEGNPLKNIVEFNPELLPFGDYEVEILNVSREQIQQNYKHILSLAKSYLDQTINPINPSPESWEVGDVYWREDKPYLDYSPK